MWSKVQNGATIGQPGPENGTIIEDEEYSHACRITLERCSKYYAITCGIYGGMFHIAFSNEFSHRKMYENMKHDLQVLIDSDTLNEEEFYEKFTSTY